MLQQSEMVTHTGSGLRLGRLLQDCGLINEHQLMDALEAQAATGGRLGTILVKRGCISQEQLASVLETQDAMRASSLALDMSVIVGGQPSATGQQIGFAVTLTKTELEHAMPFPGPPVRAHQSLQADIRQGLAVKAAGQASDGFRLKGECGAEIPYRVSITSGFDDPGEALNPGSVQMIVAGSTQDNRLKIELSVDPADLRAVPTGRFCDILNISLG